MPAARYESVIGRLAGFLRVKAPTRVTAAGVHRRGAGGGDGRAWSATTFGSAASTVSDELRPELVLLTLLPYLGFGEAQRWANQVARCSAPTEA